MVLVQFEKVRQMRDYEEINAGFGSGMKVFGESETETVKAFQGLMGAATAEGDLTFKMKELIAFAIAIAVRCDGCIAHHAKSAFDAGATRKEVTEMIGVAVLMGGGPSAVYGVEALRAYDTFAGK